MSLTITESDGWDVQTDRATITANGEGDVGHDEIRGEWRSWLANNAEVGQERLDTDSPTLYRQNIRCEEEVTGDSNYYFWRLSATYSSEQTKQERTPRDEHRIGDEDEITVSTSGDTQNVKFALACEDSAGDVVEEAKLLIGWTGGTTEEQEIEGVDVPAPSLSVTWKIFGSRNAITPAYIKRLSALKGGVNDSVWQTFEKGEARYENATLRFSPDANGRDMAVLTLEVSCVPNADLSIPGWDPDNPGQTTTFDVFKRGHSYLSRPTKTDVITSGDNDILVTLPTAAYVQQVTQYIDFNRLVP